MVEIARAQPGCHGARMTGAGFGGCAVALVAREHVSAFTARVADAYEQRMGLAPRVYVTEATAGADVVAYDFKETADGRERGNCSMRRLRSLRPSAVDRSWRRGVTTMPIAIRLYSWRSARDVRRRRAARSAHRQPFARCTSTARASSAGPTRARKSCSSARTTPSLLVGLPRRRLSHAGPQAPDRRGHGALRAHGVGRAARRVLGRLAERRSPGEPDRERPSRSGRLSHREGARAGHLHPASTPSTPTTRAGRTRCATRFPASPPTSRRAASAPIPPPSPRRSTTSSRSSTTSTRTRAPRSRTSRRSSSSR